MIVLALDTTTRAGSAAVVRDGAVVAELSGDPTLTHGQRLPGELMRVLERAGTAVGDVDLLAVAAGPGSFTGLRVGIATIQGLAMARARKVVAVSALEALAHAAGAPAGAVGAWMDAQRGEVFAALYDADRHPITEPTAASPARTLAHWRAHGDPARVTFIGDGAIRYAEAIQTATGGRATIVPPPPLAAIIGRLAAARPDRAVLPHAIMPIYIRHSDAELARARREAADPHG